MLVGGETLTRPVIPAPTTVEETGLEFEFLTDLVLKILYFTRHSRTSDICDALALPFPITTTLLDHLKSNGFCEITGSEGMMRQSFRYSLTDKGFNKIEQIIKRSEYYGPAPVPYDHYSQIFSRQTIQKRDVSRDSVASALTKLVLSDLVIEQIAAGIRSGSSMFIYGASGNGKTSIAENLGETLGGAIFIPYSVEVAGQVIRLFDPAVHKLIDPDGDDWTSRELEVKDQRWACINRPFVAVGGELTMEHLHLQYDSRGGFYDAPVQMKANGGILLIDDFGRQQVEARLLLNRWIIPLEKGIDLLRLRTGESISIPFDMLLIFASNLHPADLADEAFLRRIRYKIEVHDPTEDQFRDIFRQHCEANAIPYDDEMVTYLIEQHYHAGGRPLRACHPRDILNHIADLCHLDDSPTRISPRLIDKACASYFVDFKH